MHFGWSIHFNYVVRIDQNSSRFLVYLHLEMEILVLEYNILILCAVVVVDLHKYFVDNVC